MAQPTPPGGASRFQPMILEPGAAGAYACFGTWENAKTCQPLRQAEDPLDGCSQAVECRRYTLEQNPPTTRFTVKPRRDGRFEIQQFKDFIRDQPTYHMEIVEGEILITYPGERNVPKSRRFFLHVKHVDQAGLSLDEEFELVLTLDRMIVRQATGPAPLAADGRGFARREEEDPEARRKRIADKLRKKATADARRRDDEEEDLDIEIDIDLDLDDDDDDDEDDDDDDVEELDLDDDDAGASKAGEGEGDGADTDADDEGTSDDEELDLDGVESGDEDDEDDD